MITVIRFLQKPYYDNKSQIRYYVVWPKFPPNHWPVILWNLAKSTMCQCLCTCAITRKNTFKNYTSHVCCMCKDIDLRDTSQHGHCLAAIHAKLLSRCRVSEVWWDSGGHGTLVVKRDKTSLLLDCSNRHTSTIMMICHLCKCSIVFKKLHLLRLLRMCSWQLTHGMMVARFYWNYCLKIWSELWSSEIIPCLAICYRSTGFCRNLDRPLS